jgi:murein DD-endopeptidase MepM/ murein hydrolase activator NlpD
MGKNKLILWIYLMVIFGVNGQVKSSEIILNGISREAEIVGFVEYCIDCTNKNIWVKIPIIPPLLSTTKLKTSSKFGYRIHPISHNLKFHSGIDMITLETDTVVATACGIVQRMGYQNGLGLFIVIEHQYGFTTLYGHFNAIFVKPNQVINVAQPIGLVGNTGLVTGKHLHYSIIKNGFYLNPSLMMYLFLKTSEY